MEKGAAVHAVSEDARRRGIPEAGALPGIQWADQKGVAGLFQEARRVLAW